MAVVPFAKTDARPAETPPEPGAPADADSAEWRFSTRRLTIVGGAIMGVFVVGLLVWAAVAPLSGAILAPGKVTVEGQWKVVEAPETAMVTELRVAEGQNVVKGELLLRLDKTQAQANYDSLSGVYLSLLGQRAKLNAEDKNLPAIEFPPELSDLSDPEVQAVVSFQQSDFRARRLSLESTLARIRGQIAVTEEEFAALSALDEGLVSRSRTFPLRISLAQLRSQEAEIQLQTAAQRAAEWQQVEGNLAEITPKMHGARVVLEQLDIRATASGKVLGLTEYTVGGVVTIGEKIMDIVPSDTDFLVEAAVRPEDIDDLKLGMEALVQLTALQQRTTPSVKGVVTYVAADRITTEDADFYAIKVRIDDAELDKLGGNVQLYPGMPTEVMIPTHKRTALDYILQPVTDTVFRSFREP